MKSFSDSLRVLCLAVLAVILFKLFPNFLSFAHSITNLVVGSKSTIKVFLGIVFVVTLFIIRDVHLLKKPAFNYKKLKLLSVIFFSVAGFLYVANAFSFFYFTNTRLIPSENFILVLNNNEISSTRLTHNHVLKGAVGLVTTLYSKGHFENTDTGTAFVGFMPNAFFVIIVILFAILIWLSFRIYPLLLDGYDTVKKQRAFTILYAAATFVLMTRVIDGGFWADGAIVGIIISIFLIIKNLRNKVVVSALLLGFYAATLGILCSFGYANTQEIFSSSYNNLALVSFCLLLLAYIKAGKMNLLPILLTVLVALFPIMPIFLNQNSLSYRNLKLSSDSVVGLYNAPKDSLYTLKNSVGSMSFYTPDPSKKTVGEILDENKLLDNYYPVSVPGETCFSHGKLSKYSFSFVTPNKISGTFKAPPFVQVKKLTYQGEISGQHYYRITVGFEPCFPRQLNIIDEIFKSNGITTVILYNFIVDQPTFNA